MYQRKYCFGVSKALVVVDMGKTDLACTDFIESDERKCLSKHGASQIFLCQ
jgi:hypothetical protein